MKSIITTYPGFQTLPKGIKMLLLASEDFFFGEAGSSKEKPKASANKRFSGRAGRASAPAHDLSERFPVFGALWRN
jgi:hypothetical protein